MISILKHKLNALYRDCEGIAALEMSLIMVAIFAATPLIFDLASAINASMTLSGGVRAGAALAVLQPNNTSGITQAIRTASGFSSATVSTSEFCECSGVSATCGIACYGGANPYKYIRITASYSMPTLLPYPGFPESTYPLSSSVTIRTQ